MMMMPFTHRAKASKPEITPCRPVSAISTIDGCGRSSTRNGAKPGMSWPPKVDGLSYQNKRSCLGSNMFQLTWDYLESTRIRTWENGCSPAVFVSLCFLSNVPGADKARSRYSFHLTLARLPSGPKWKSSIWTVYIPNTPCMTYMPTLGWFWGSMGRHIWQSQTGRVWV